MKKWLSFILFAFSFQAVHSQTALTIYADYENEDSIHRLVDILKEQLNSSRAYQINVKNKRDYKGSGIYISKGSSGNQSAKVPARLLSAGTEGFSVLAGKNSVEILGNSNNAIGHGIFTWLESLGYRYYFAHPDWHIAPSDLKLYGSLNIVSKPSFANRRIVYGYGTGSVKADKDFEFWHLANRMGGSINPSYGHTYEDIIARNQAAFKAHPEWFYPIPAKGVIPDNPKFDMSKEDLVQLIITDAIQQVEASLKSKSEAYKMISMSPSDGGGTCNTPACQKLGTITDRVYYLANRVAAALKQKYPSTWVGCLAYSEYIAPPTKKIEPNIFVVITTAFNNSSLTTEQLVDEWRKKGATIGIYDYFSWFAWDFDIPGQCAASRIPELEKSIRRFYNKGVSGYHAESSTGWISKGLGYYIASKLMWDATLNTSSLKKEFFKLCFRKSAPAMEKLWNEWESYGFTRPREGDLARWMDEISEAEKQEPAKDVQKRFYQIKSYLHYLYLYRVYTSSKSESDLLTILSYGFRMLDLSSVSGYPAFFELGNRSGIPGMAWGADAKWRINSTPMSVQEMNEAIRADRTKLTIAPPVKSIAPTLKFRNIPNLSQYKSILSDSAGTDNGFWLTDEWVIEIKNKGTNNYIEIFGGGDTTIRQPTKISFYNHSPEGNLVNLTPIMVYDYKAHRVKEKINLSGLKPGYYSILIQDPVRTYRIKFSDAINFSLVMRPNLPIQTLSLNYAFIYVPKGIKRFNVVKSRAIKFVTPTGRHVDLVKDAEQDLQVEVKENESGLWRITFVTDRIFIEGIPPFLGVSARQMLIPFSEN
jgi:hypothetical protein